MLSESLRADARSMLKARRASGNGVGCCDEFSCGFNRRGEQLQMFDGTLKNIPNEKALPYKTLVRNQ